LVGAPPFFAIFRYSSNVVSERGAAAQVSIAAKNSTSVRDRKHFLICVGAQMPFFSAFAQTLVAVAGVQQRNFTRVAMCGGFDL
jgi:hypothetical protein